jgi:hypothetical protein
VPQLRWLELDLQESHVPVWGMRDVAAVLPQLQRLRLYGMHFTPAAAAAAASPAAVAASEAEAAANCVAITASTALSLLSLEHCRLPAGALQHMFPAGKQLPQLQLLAIHCIPAALSDVDFSLESDTAAVRSCSLAINADDVAQLVACCPNLRELSTLWVDGSSSSFADAAQLSRALTSLTSLTGLTKLGVGGAAWDNAAAEEVVAHMPGEGYMCACIVLLCVGSW